MNLNEKGNLSKNTKNKLMRGDVGISSYSLLAF